MNRIECFACKKTPVNTPIGKLCDFYMSGSIPVCETCLDEIVESAYEAAFCPITNQVDSKDDR